MQRARGIALAVMVGGLVAWGCATAFPPDYVLSGPRILALRASPTELMPDGGVVLDALVWAPGSPALTYSWSWCPSLGGADDNYACSITAQALSSDLSPDGGLTLSYAIGSTPAVDFRFPVDPDQLHSLCFRARATADGGLPDGGSVDAGPTDAGSEVVDAGPLPDGGAAPVTGFGGGVLSCNSTLAASVLLTLGVDGQQLTAYAPLTFAFDANVTPHPNSQLLGLLLFAPGSDTPVAPGTALKPGVAYTLVAQVPEAATAVASTTPTLPDGGLPDGGGAFDAGVAPVVDAGTGDGGPTFPFARGERLGAVSLAWYVQGGALAAATTSLPATVVFDGGTDGRDWSQLQENVWVTPTTGTSATLIVVLRDDDNGVDWISQTWSLAPAGGG